MPRLADTIYAFRFLRLLTMPWEKTEAYKRGIIDGNGKVLKKDLTLQDDKAAYTLFHRLVFNIRKLIQKVPGGQSKIATYAAALFLIKENTGLSEKEIQEVLDEADIKLYNANLTESWMLNEDTLGAGRYVLTEDIASPSTGNLIAQKGSTIIVGKDCTPVDTIFNAHIYQVMHEHTKQKIYVTVGDIKR